MSYKSNYISANKLVLYQKKKGLRKNGWNDWKVKEIIVDDETHEHGHLFEINQWIKGDEDYFFESVASTHEMNDPAE